MATMTPTTTVTNARTTTSTTKPAEPEFPLLGYLDGMMEDLRSRVPAALKLWDVEAIHQSRVATRRMKAAVDLMRVVLNNRLRRPFAKVTRNLRRRLGPLRDADVMLEHLEELRSQGKHERAIIWLSERVGREREALRAASAKQGPPAVVLAKLGAWWAVREEILAARDAVDTLLAESLHLQLDAFAEQADRLVLQTNTKRAKPLPAAGAAAPEALGVASGPAPVEPMATGTPDGNGVSEGAARQMPVPAPSGLQDPHELRISGKVLRYTLELAVVQGHKLPGSVTKRFKKMQEGLGFWHDYVVLADRAMQAGLDEQLGHHEPGLMDELLELVRGVLRRATHHLDKFNRLWTHEGEALTKSIRASFPLTRPIAAPPASLEPAPRTRMRAATAGKLGAEPSPLDTGKLRVETSLASRASEVVSEPKTGPGPDGSEAPPAPARRPPAAPANV